MSVSVSRSQALVALSDSLRVRKSELEQAVVTRIDSVSDASDGGDLEYREGLQAAIGVALEHALDAIGQQNDPGPVPTVLLSQARLAARNGITLGTVLRRYFAGHALLGDFLIEEARELGHLDEIDLQGLLRGLAALFDHVIAAVTEEYSRESAVDVSSLKMRRAQLVKRLLAGEPVESSELDYDFDGAHLGMIASGLDAKAQLQSALGRLDARSLFVRSDGGAVWAWFGSRSGAVLPSAWELLTQARLSNVCVAIGEPSSGLAGWRLTHRQARAALAVGLKDRATVVRYAEVAIPASMLQDKLLVTSLHALYLNPLSQERDGGRSARRTLRAYMAAERNITSAAAALGVNRNTVTSRLRLIEERIGRSLASCVMDLEVALRLEELAEGAPPEEMAHC